MDGAPVAEGDVLAGKYRIERVLGEGGMGVVVAATHLDLHQRVALKFLKPEALENKEIVARFAREARAAAKIQSEHVARVIDVGTLETGSPYMVMEYLEGRDLGAVLEERGAIPAVEAVGYVLQACEALAEAHAAGIVHRDLKPANLFLAARAGQRTVVKLLDFGISKSTGKPDEVSLTRTTAVMGSPQYMSPEQMTSAKLADARSDIWALGVMLYQLITGDPPFIAETMPEMIAAVLMQQPATPDVAKCPPELSAVLLRCLEKAPAKRYQTVAELALALTPFAPPEQRVSAERASRVLGSGAATASRPPTDAPPPSRRSAAPDAATQLGDAARPLAPPASRPPADAATQLGDAPAAPIESEKSNASWGRTQPERAPVPSGRRNTALFAVAAVAVAIVAAIVARPSAAPATTPATTEPALPAAVTAAAPPPVVPSPSAAPSPAPVPSAAATPSAAPIATMASPPAAPTVATKRARPPSAPAESPSPSASAAPTPPPAPSATTKSALELNLK